MSDATPNKDSIDQWVEMMDEMNRTTLEAFEENVQMQAQFVESWIDTVENDQAIAETMDEGLEGYARAYQTWMEAAVKMLEQTNDAVEGEDISTDEFRDIWLRAANDSFKDVMETSTFAAVTGATVSDVLEYQEKVDETAAETLHSLGFATKNDVQEIGERLVEFERRQHAVEKKLDRLLDAMES
ncbi:MULTISPECIES: poly(R)-hydroxyalkanoic acid synthase subunit PhaE [Haloferax]|uniref:Poly(3-hydroxyalkanoate) polymerase subunit PhaE n=2 Tax=Haloferax TaxID=2251 RepID=A0A6G1Z2Q4_9EURY|nr:MULTISPECIES: poly(R)-hydroxyalkanoic acid synthase subunit PhaE [Haloferax]KAB1188149.1 poly(R)-hydroxyalkanoic acid synthase subunit [Haloferax sp. CBA1149]MRW80826.1 poly(R)-hydroxyalkanoic acid synthase subunit [Haloferax marinisediminis]